MRKAIDHEAVMQTIEKQNKKARKTRAADELKNDEMFEINTGVNVH